MKHCIACIAYIAYMIENSERTIPISIRVNPREWDEFKRLCRKEEIVSATAGINILIVATLKKIVSLNNLESLINKEPAENQQNEPENELKSLIKSIEELDQKVKVLEELSQNRQQDIVQNLAQVNQGLTLCCIRKKGKRLYIRATLPLKEGIGKKSQELKTGAIANQEGLLIAQLKAKKLETDLMLGRFQWNDWLS